jgi:glycosyltransferase involved in cell wall biosynthesis
MQAPDFEHETTCDQSVSEFPLVSVIISNYNFERFLAEAIDSALDQTYSNVEVIVVDDGSTDDSRRIIAGYGKRIVTVLKENGGQANACNVGFQASKGEIVIFLDADDMLLPATVQRVVAAFQSKPGVAKVQYRLQIVNSSAKPIGEFIPASTTPLPSGDMRQSLMEHGTYAWPSTSGNAFAAVVLRRIMPISENVYRGMPDIYLSSLSVLFGHVISLEKPGALYRVHGGNNHYRPRGSVEIDSYIDQWRTEFFAISDAYVRTKGLLSTMYSVDTTNMKFWYYRDMYGLCQRMISLKLDRPNHPIKETPSALFVQGCLLFVSDSNSWSRRLFCLPWLAAMLLAPKPLSWPLVRALENARWVRNKLISLLRQRTIEVERGTFRLL